jgi:hypothetical protein
MDHCAMIFLRLSVPNSTLSTNLFIFVQTYLLFIVKLNTIKLCNILCTKIFGTVII